MHKLGILGLGSKSTLYYIEKLNIEYNKLMGSYSTCPFIMVNADFNTINPHLPNDFNKLKPIIESYLYYFESLEIDCLLVPNITLHQTIDMVIAENDFTFKIIHPVKLAIDELLKCNINEVTILGSKYTMTNNYLKEHLLDFNISINNLKTNEIEIVDALRKQLYDGNVSSTSSLNKIIQELPKNNIPLIACTELSLITNSTKTTFVDMAQLQIKEALNLILN